MNYIINGNSDLKGIKVFNPTGQHSKELDSTKQEIPGKNVIEMKIELKKKWWKI